MVPFSSYSVLPAQAIVKANVRSGHVRIFSAIIFKFQMFEFFFQVKEDIESLLRPLVPLLHISKPEIPKPTCIDSYIIQKLAAKVCLDLFQSIQFSDRFHFSLEHWNCYNFSVLFRTAETIVR
jgi:hypothetical protein